ncbi:acetyl-CoA acetyltransferase [Roseivirga seohaensis]|uniref:acetyl-CoA C-acyltransferase n=2 Tax=Roseivirga seohaensis TaxID=1914963 RepID=A0A0L8AQM4_9BACT|nr:acetyl-CoA C-acyltransferase [Roseivirga seohaensis]KOF04535.1 acetyl-CoA acetyltransferase [Roseivirga seohaensis subsp. aquiponti]KYG84210.1 acetyl-CoA acetyltransferase [Roseivirga seohaensis]
MDAYIVAGYRTAVGRGKRSVLKSVRSDDMAAEVIKHLVGQVANFDPTRVDDLIVGNAVPEAEQGMQMGRMISLLSLPIPVPGVTVNRYCGSGLEAIALASARIHAGTADCIIAGGTESMSQVPVMGYKTALNYKLATEHKDYYLSMGLTAEQVGKEFKITREESDQFAFESHQKAVKAQADGKFDDEIVPIKVTEKFVDANGKMAEKSYTVDKDEGPRADTSMEVLAGLRPVFAQGGQVTAGNSSPVSDGASFVMVMSEKMVKELGLEPIARMVTYTAVGVHPRIMGIGPVDAVPKALKQAGLKQSDLDLIELNEAFGAQSLAVIKELDLDRSILNVNGGAIALGHPLGCSGAKLSVQLFNEMRRRGNAKYGMVTACVGGGQGVAGIYEFLK